jgi:hypothetical protein
VSAIPDRRLESIATAVVEVREGRRRWGLHACFIYGAAAAGVRKSFWMAGAEPSDDPETSPSGVADTATPQGNFSIQQ